MEEQTSVIIDFKVESDKALQQQIQLKKTMEELRAAQKELAAQQRDSSTATAENAEAMVINEAKMKNLQNQILNNSKIIQANSQDVKDGTGAYRQLSDAYLFASAKAKDLAVAYGEQDERTKAAVAAAKAMSDQLKAVDSSVGQNTRRVGDYSGEIGGLAGKFSQMPGALGQMGKGVDAATNAFKDMNAASPIGWITMLIGVISNLVGKFMDFAPVADAVENSLAKLGAVFSVLKNTVIAVVTGQKSLGEALKGTTEEIKKQTEEAGRLAEAQRDLEDRQEAMTLQQQKYQNEIDKRLLQSKNLTLDEKERMRLIDEALQIESKAFNERKKLVDDEVKLRQDKLIQQGNLTAKEADLLRKGGLEYARDVENRKNLKDDEIKALAAALTEQARIEGESIKVRERALARRDKIEEEAQIAAEKRAARIAKLEEARRIREEQAVKDAIYWETVKQLELESIMEKGMVKAQELAAEALKPPVGATDEALAAIQQRAALEYEAEMELKQLKWDGIFEAERMQLEKEYTAKILNAEKVGADTTAITEAYTKVQTELKRQEVEHSLDLASNFAGNLAAIFGENTKVGKMAASAQVTIDTYKGAVSAYASLAGIPVVGPVLGIAAAGAAIASGVKAVRNIWAVKSGLPRDSGSGGSSIQSPMQGTSTPSSSMGSLISRQSGVSTQQAQVATMTAAQSAQPVVQPVLVTSNITDVQSRQVLLSEINSL